MAKKVENPQMQIEYWDVEKLIPYARNPRKNDDAVPKMAGVIKEFGFKVPIVAKSDGSKNIVYQYNPQKSIPSVCHEVFCQKF